MLSIRLVRALIVATAITLAIAQQSTADFVNTASTGYIWNDNLPGKAAGGTKGGTWSLGENSATVADMTVTVPKLTGDYVENLEKSIPTAEMQIGDTKATAEGAITIGAKTDTGYFPYALTYNAKTDSAFINPRHGEATAKASDPQFIQTPGIFDYTISLSPGSSVFSNGAGGATSFFQITAPDLSGPLATINLATSSTGLQAIVVFSNDSHLSFFNPITGSTINGEQVAAALQASNLGSEAGLTSVLPLFRFVDDLRGETLPPDAAFGSAGENTAFTGSAVPEPSSAALVSISLMAFVVYWIVTKMKINRPGVNSTPARFSSVCRAS
jgi:hypothetical protein